MRRVGPLRAARCRVIADDQQLPETHIPTTDAAWVAKVWTGSLYAAQDRDELHPVLWRGAMFWDRTELEAWGMDNEKQERARRRVDASRIARSKE